MTVKAEIEGAGFALPDACPVCGARWVCDHDRDGELLCVACEHPALMHNAAGCGIEQCGCMAASDRLLTKRDGTTPETPEV